MTKRRIQFEMGPGHHYDDVNYMMDEAGELYAECAVPSNNVFEDYGYNSLKKAIIELAEEHGISADELEFQYDGQEQFLSEDADAYCAVYSDYSGD